MTDDYAPQFPVVWWEEAAFCEGCDLVHPQNRDPRTPYRWRCLAAPTKPGYGFVSWSYSPDPPYGLCDRKNFDGKCPDFTPIRTPDDAKTT